MFRRFVEVHENAGLHGGDVEECFQGLGTNGTYQRGSGLSQVSSLGGVQMDQAVELLLWVMSGELNLYIQGNRKKYGH